MSKKQESNAAASDPITSELIAIKRLLIFDLLRNGAKQDQVAAALGISQSAVSKMFKKGAFDDGGAR